MVENSRKYFIVENSILPPPSIPHIIRDKRDTTILVAATNNSLATIYILLYLAYFIFHISYILRLVFALDPSFDCIRQEASNKQQATRK